MFARDAEPQQHGFERVDREDRRVERAGNRVGDRGLPGSGQPGQQDEHVVRVNRA
jgi:hypothetical protein